MLAPLFAFLAASPLARAQDEPIGHNQVVIVLDGSGSMEGKMPDGKSKMHAAKAALHQVVLNLPQDTHVGLLVFSSNADGWAYPLGPRNDTALSVAIDGAKAGGGTPLGAYIKKGADALLDKRAEEHNYGTYRLLVVTDGEATDSRLMMRYAPEVVARGIRFDVIGVAMAKSHTLKNLADSYRAADDSEQLVRAVSAVFAEIDASDSADLQGEVFEVLDGLPDPVALAMIEALTSSAYLNQPLGEKPPAPKRLESPPAPVSEPAPEGPPPACGSVPLPPQGAVFLGLGWLFLRRRR